MKIFKHTIELVHHSKPEMIQMDRPFKIVSAVSQKVNQVSIYFMIDDLREPKGKQSNFISVVGTDQEFSQEFKYICTVHDHDQVHVWHVLKFMGDY